MDFLSGTEVLTSEIKYNIVKIDVISLLYNPLYFAIFYVTLNFYKFLGTEL